MITRFSHNSLVIDFLEHFLEIPAVALLEFRLWGLASLTGKKHPPKKTLAGNAFRDFPVKTEK